MSGALELSALLTLSRMAAQGSKKFYEGCQQDTLLKGSIKPCEFDRPCGERRLLKNKNLTGANGTTLSCSYCGDSQLIDSGEGRPLHGIHSPGWIASHSHSQ